MKVINLKTDNSSALFNLSFLEKTNDGAEYWVNKSLKADANNEQAIIIKAALRLYQGDRNDFDNLLKSKLKNHVFMSSIS